MRKTGLKQQNEVICKIGKKISGSEMQETVEEKWKTATREKRRQERERVRRKLRKK